MSKQFEILDRRSLMTKQTLLKGEGWIQHFSLSSITLKSEKPSILLHVGEYHNGNNESIQKLNDIDEY